MERLANRKFETMEEFCDEKECLIYKYCHAIKKHNRLFEYEEIGLMPAEIVAKLKWADHTAKVLHDIFGDVGVYNLSNIKDLISRTQWIPVTDRYPGKGKEYLCRCICNGCEDLPFYMVLGYVIYDKNPHFQHEQTGGMSVTHWMPLPEPPQGVKK